MNKSVDLQKPKLTLFIDGRCPLCVMEMRHLKKRDLNENILLEDIQKDDFAHRYPDIDRERAMAVLHARTDSGELLFGLDATHRAWSLVGCGWRTAFLRWPLIRIVTDYTYHFFARHRHHISKLLTGKDRLDDCDACSNIYSANHTFSKTNFSEANFSETLDSQVIDSKSPDSNNFETKIAESGRDKSKSNLNSPHHLNPRD